MRDARECNANVHKQERVCFCSRRLRAMRKSFNLNFGLLNLKLKMMLCSSQLLAQCTRECKACNVSCFKRVCHFCRLVNKKKNFVLFNSM